MKKILLASLITCAASSAEAATTYTFEGDVRYHGSSEPWTTGDLFDNATRFNMSVTVDNSLTEADKVASFTPEIIMYGILDVSWTIGDESWSYGVSSGQTSVGYTGSLNSSDVVFVENDSFVPGHDYLSVSTGSWIPVLDDPFGDSTGISVNRAWIGARTDSDVLSSLDISGLAAFNSFEPHYNTSRFGTAAVPGSPGFGGLELQGFGAVDLMNVRLTEITTPVPASAVPEPATWLMMIMGFGLVGVASRRRKIIAT